MFDDINNDKDENKDDFDGPKAASPQPASDKGKEPAGLGPQDALELAKAGIKKQEAGTEKKPAGSPGKVEDIFADTDDLSVSTPAAPASTPPFKDGGQARTGAPAGGVKKLIMLAVIILVIAGLGYGGYWLYANFIAGGESLPDVTTDLTATDEPAAPASDNTEDVVAEPEAPVVETPVAAPDADQDGLSDEEELQLGTSPATVDSDNDGLFDREEVKVYATDPLNPDTDGDGYLDGDEVKDGYNPLGPGKLYQLDQE